MTIPVLCPFCNSLPVISYSPQSHQYFVFCDNSTCRNAPMVVEKAEDAAVESWNLQHWVSREKEYADLGGCEPAEVFDNKMVEVLGEFEEASYRGDGEWPFRPRKSHEWRPSLWHPSRASKCHVRVFSETDKLSVIRELEERSLVSRTSNMLDDDGWRNQWEEVSERERRRLELLGVQQLTPIEEAIRQERRRAKRAKLPRRKFATRAEYASVLGGIPEEEARFLFESARWPNGPVCPHCGNDRKNIWRFRNTSARPGLLGCGACRRQFTVTIGTVMEDTRIPLSKWITAYRMIRATDDRVPAFRVQRELGIGSTLSATRLLRRIRAGLLDVFSLNLLAPEKMEPAA